MVFRERICGVYMVSGAPRNVFKLFGGCIYGVFKVSGSFRKILYMGGGFRGFMSGRSTIFQRIGMLDRL